MSGGIPYESVEPMRHVGLSWRPGPVASEKNVRTPLLAVLIFAIRYLAMAPLELQRANKENRYLPFPLHRPTTPWQQFEHVRQHHLPSRLAFAGPSEEVPRWDF